MTEKSNSEDLLDLDLPTDLEETFATDENGELVITTEELADSKYEASKEEEKQFLTGILGKEHAAEAMNQIPRAPQEIDATYDDRSNNPRNKPLHESVTERYFTAGGKEVVAKHDEMGSFWRVEFVPGGQLPMELQGRWTNEPEARKAIRLYLAKQG